MCVYERQRGFSFIWKYTKRGIMVVDKLLVRWRSNWNGSTDLNSVRDLFKVLRERGDGLFYFSACENLDNVVPLEIWRYALPWMIKHKAAWKVFKADRRCHSQVLYCHENFILSLFPVVVAYSSVAYLKSKCFALPISCVWLEWLEFCEHSGTRFFT